MTANQINYQKHLEDVRSHKASEAISARQAEASETSARASMLQAGSGMSQAETAQRNAETNVLNAEANRISAQASQTMAAASYLNAQAEQLYKEAKIEREKEAQLETQRHNMAMESNDLIGLTESERHNRSTESKDLLKIESDRDIAYLNRLESARQADQSAGVTERGQNINAIVKGAEITVNGLLKAADIGASLLKPFKAGFNAGKLTNS